MGLTSTTQHRDILDKMFDHEVVTPVAPGMAENRFTTTSVDNLPAPGQVSEAGQLIKAIHDDVAEWYCKTYNKAEMNTYELGDDFDAVRGKFVNNPQFNKVLELLQIDHNEANLIKLPWWNGSVFGQTPPATRRMGWDVVPPVIPLVPLHSYYVQILQNREDGARPIYPVHGAGLIITARSDEAPNGYIALGLRAGNVYPNTLHLIAGALSFDPENTEYSLRSLFHKSVLDREAQVKVDNIREIALFARLIDRGLTPGDILYAFRVTLKLTKEELESKMGSEGERRQHTRFTFIKNDPESIRDALQKLYTGKTINNRNRTIEQVEILHPAALALAAHAGIQLEELRNIAANCNSG